MIGVGKLAWFWTIVTVVIILAVIGAVAYLRVRMGMITGM
jgi:hypothetical protein